ncbi:MAG: SPFH domain-containing protein, partial [Thermoguttaceae bacterium]
MIQEKPVTPMSGWVPLVVTIVLLVLSPLAIVSGAVAESGLLVFFGILSALAFLLMLFGFQAVAPNDARVLLLFGDYRGSITRSGFYWVNPFFSKRKITLRIRNFETGALTTPEKKDAAGNIVQHKARSAGRPAKVNDRDGNPIDISAIVVWRV